MTREPVLEVPPSSLKTTIGERLADARSRTRALLGGLPDVELQRQHSPLQSPLVWDLAHIGHFEELWLVRRVAGGEPVLRAGDELYDAFRHARSERSALPLLEPAAAWRYLAEVRERTLDALEKTELDPEAPLLANGFVYGLVIQHELQHHETMLQTLQIRDEPYVCPRGWARPGATSRPGEALVEGSTAVVGTDDEPWAYDNESPAHLVALEPFRIDIAPVTNAAYLEFVGDGGYREPRWWTAAGWAWRQDRRVEHPEYWLSDGAGGWIRRRFGVPEPLAPDEPVEHVSWYEADAYARWAGRRLPTEQEWEVARRDGVIAPAGVWEWTSSDFVGYPGFRAFPYREYSEVFFGDDYKVLRSASWATHPTVARPTFRNWDYPIRRQIFAGFRCAGDA